MNYEALTKFEQVRNEREKRVREYNLKIAKTKEFISDIANKEGFKVLLQLIKDLSLWDDNVEDITPETLIYKKGRRDLWFMIRDIVPKDLLADIEIYNKYRIKVEEKEGD